MIKSVEITQKVIKAQITSGGRKTIVSVKSNNRVKAATIGIRGLTGRNGVDGDSVGQPPPIGFAWNNVSPRVVYTMPMDGFIISVMVSIETTFNGIGAALSVGTNTNPQLLVAQTEVDPSQIADFEIGSSEFLNDGTQIILTTNPGANASSGSGFLIIKYIAV